MLSSLTATTTTSSTTSSSSSSHEPANRLRMEALALLLCVVRRGSVTARLRAIRSTLKILRVDLSTYCSAVKTTKGSSSTAPVLLSPSSREGFSAIAQLGQACSAAFSISTDPNNDPSFVSTDALGALLSFLGADAEILLGVAREYASAGLTKDTMSTMVSLLQPLVHASGALKNLSVNQAQQARLGRLGALHICTGVLLAARRVLDVEALTQSAGPKQPAADDTDGIKDVRDRLITLLIQVTGTLRNLCADKVRTAA